LSKSVGELQVDQVPLISGEMVRSLIDIDGALRAIEQAYADYGKARRVLSDPPALLMPDNAAGQAAFKVKGARLTSLGVAGFRMIADRETEAGEETIDYCWVADSATGRLLGLVDETWLHRLRTALTGVVAAKWLARPESRVAVIIGAGKIADELPAALARVFGLAEIRVVGRRIEAVEAFAQRHGTASVPVKPFTELDTAAKGADIILCITSATSPVLHARHLAPGMFICGLGGGAEIAADVLDRADRFIVDELAYALTIGSVRGWAEAGLARDAIARRVDADIGEIAIGAKSRRQNADEIVLSIVQGMACCDLALAHHVLSRAGLAAQA
jgi:ornithine cyclodeaminase